MQISDLKWCAVCRSDCSGAVDCASDVQLLGSFVYTSCLLFAGSCHVSTMDLA